MSVEFANGIKKIFFTVIAILSMATSFLYFVEVFSFGEGIVSSTWVSVMVNGVIGILVLDLAAMAWLKIYLQASDNNTLRTLATVGFVIGFVGSAVASFAYLLTVASGYQMTGDARIYTQLAMAVVIVAHFALVFLSIFKATSAKIDEKTASLLSEGTEEMLKLTDDYFRELIPALAKQNARKLADELKTKFTSMSALTGDDAEGQPQALPAPSPVTTKWKIQSTHNGEGFERQYEGSYQGATALAANLIYQGYQNVVIKDGEQQVVFGPVRTTTLNNRRSAAANASRQGEQYTNGGNPSSAHVPFE